MDVQALFKHRDLKNTIEEKVKGDLRVYVRFDVAEESWANPLFHNVASLHRYIRCPEKSRHLLNVFYFTSTDTVDYVLNILAFSISKLVVPTLSCGTIKLSEGHRSLAYYGIAKDATLRLSFTSYVPCPDSSCKRVVATVDEMVRHDAQDHKNALGSGKPNFWPDLCKNTFSWSGEIDRVKLSVCLCCYDQTEVR